MIEWALQSIFPARTFLVGFEDVLHAQKTPDKYSILNTLPNAEQSVLISGTISASDEEEFINQYINSGNPSNQKTIILYGRNSCDDSPRKKRNQLLSLGIGDVFIYSGGLFEWLLLQDIYSKAEFPITTSTTGTVDLLAYRPKRLLP